MTDETDERLRAIEARLCAIEARLGMAGAPRPAAARPQPPEGSGPDPLPGTAGGRLSSLRFRLPGAADGAPAHRLSESALGGTWMARIGMAVLLTGLLFLAKYSWDSGWLGPEARVLSVFLASAVLLAGGEAATRRPSTTRYGVLLTGGGICAAFFATWAAHRMFALVGTPAAAAGYLAATAAGLLLSLRYARQSPAFLGLVGGIATPLLLSTGKTRTYELFGYLAALSAAALWAALPRGWRATLGGTLLGAILLYLGWWNALHGGGNPAFPSLAAGAFLLVALVFNGLAAARETGASPWRAIYGFSTLAFSWALALALEHGGWTVHAALPPAGIALVFLAATHLSGAEPDARRRYATLALGAALLVPLTQVTERRFAVVLAVEALALAFAARRTGDRLTGGAARIAILWAVADAASFLPWHDSPFQPWRPLLNERFATGAGVAACAFLAGWKLPFDRLFGGERGHDRSVILASGYALLVAALSFEAHDLAVRKLHFENPEFAAGVAVTGVWTLCALATVAGGFWKGRAEVRWAGLLLFAATVGKVFLFDLGRVGTIYRVVSFLALGAVLLLVAWGYNRIAGAAGDER